MNDRLRLAELLTIRLCHDLSGPLGTLMGALELLREEPEAAEEALDLAGEVSHTLVKRLRLLRAAWGGASAPLGLDELSALTEGLPQGAKVRLAVDALADRRFAPDGARLVLNLLLLAGESLPGGGTITLAGDPQAEIQLFISGARAAWPAGLAASLADPDHAWSLLSNGTLSSRTMQAPLTALIAHTSGIGVSMMMAREADAAPPLVVHLPESHRATSH